jgi:hypothetical protein
MVICYMEYKGVYEQPNGQHILPPCDMAGGAVAVWRTGDVDVALVGCAAENARRILVIKCY